MTNYFHSYIQSVQVMKFLILLFVSILSPSSQNLIKSHSFLTSDDFRRANELSDEEIDKGEGIVSTKAEFNSSFYGGDVVEKPPLKRKDVHGYITRSSGRHWTNGRVPYQFVDDFTTKEREHIAKAIQYFEDKTCIRIVPRNSTDKRYIKFVKKHGCYSQGLGRNKRRPQELSLGKGCIRVDVIIHELMHAIGFMHEFSRPDRDQYINISYDNMNPNTIPQFRKIDGEYFGDWKLPFDIKSAMFYEGNAGAKSRGLTVMRAKNGDELRCKPHSCPTELDAQKINKVYGCEASVTEGTNNCTSLKWKSSHSIDKEMHNPVQIKGVEGKMVNICRSELWNGDMILGIEGKYGCRGTRISYSRWKYDILTNPSNVKIDWLLAKSPPINAIYVGKSRSRDLYVNKCTFNSNSKQCLKVKYLIC